MCVYCFSAHRSFVNKMKITCVFFQYLQYKLFNTSLGGLHGVVDKGDINLKKLRATILGPMSSNTAYPERTVVSLSETVELHTIQ